MPFIPPTQLIVAGVFVTFLHILKSFFFFTISNVNRVFVDIINITERLFVMQCKVNASGWLP